MFTKFLEQVLLTGIAFPCPSALKHRQACHEQDEGRKNYQGCIGVEINLLYKPFRNNLQGFKKNLHCFLRMISEVFFQCFQAGFGIFEHHHVSATGEDFLLAAWDQRCQFPAFKCWRHAVFSSNDDQAGAADFWGTLFS